MHRRFAIGHFGHEEQQVNRDHLSMSRAQRRGQRGIDFIRYAHWDLLSSRAWRGKFLRDNGHVGMGYGIEP